MSDYKNNSKKPDSSYRNYTNKKIKDSNRSVCSDNRKNKIYNNIKLTNNESNIMGVNNYLSKLKKNYSQEYINFSNINKRNELNIINNITVNLDSNNNKNILIDNKKLLKKIYQNKKINNLKSQYLNKNNINNSNIINKSTNYIDSKTLDDTKSKLENQNNPNINSNINEDYINSQSQIQNGNQNENNEEGQKHIKIVLPPLSKFIKKNRMKKNVSYLIKSKNKNISANDIYLHYLKENEIEKSKNKIEYNSTLVEFSKYLKDNDYKKFNYDLEKIYGDDKNFVKRINELKKNNNIAFKKDFNIQDYQRTILKLLKKRISDKSMENLDQSYKLFNERNFGMMIPRGRYINLADKLKDFLSKEIYEKVKRMDRNYKIFLEKNEEMKHRNSLEFKNKNNFYKALNKTIIDFGRKKKDKEKKEFY